MYFCRKISAGRAYLQIVESRRNGDQVGQQVIATLGRFDELQASGELDRLVRSGARFATKALEDRIAALGGSSSGPQIVADLDSLSEIEIEHDGKRFVVCSRRQPCVAHCPRRASARPAWR